MWNEVKVNTCWHLHILTVSLGTTLTAAQTAPSTPPLEGDGLSSSWSSAASISQQRENQEEDSQGEQLLLTWATLTILAVSYLLQLLCKTLDWWLPGKQLLLKITYTLDVRLSDFPPRAWGESTLWTKSRDSSCQSVTRSSVSSELRTSLSSVFLSLATRPPTSVHLPHVHREGYCREGGGSLGAGAAFAEINMIRDLRFAGAWLRVPCSPADVIC